MITFHEIKVLDKNAEFVGIPPEKLMENAGKSIATFIKETFEHPKILVFCGTGNNGGDGFVAARHLSKDFEVTLFLVGREKDVRSNISRLNFSKLKTLPLTLHDFRSADLIPELIDSSSIIVDAMLGIGISGNLRDPYKHIVQLINSSSGKKVIAVDVPTGLGSKTAIQPDYTLTFHDQKVGMDKKNSGKISVIDIDIPPEAVEYIGPGDLAVHYPRPSKQSHKGQNGKVLVIGGGPFTGAPTLSALASLRTGADLVYIATPKKNADIIAGYSPNFIMKPLMHANIVVPDDLRVIGDVLPKIDAVVLGPGLGDSYDTDEAVRAIVPTIVEAQKPLVIDADAIKAIGMKKESVKGSATVITPHAMEFIQFSGTALPQDINKKKQIITKWAKRYGIAIFLKGHIDILSDGKMTKANKVHNEAMTVGGTGDVLAGIIGGLLAKGCTTMQAMRIAAFLNGEAGNFAFQKKSYGLLATDVIKEIPAVLHRYLL